MANEPKIYVPKCKAKAVSFRDGGEIIKLGFEAAALVQFIHANTNERGYINLNVGKRREVGQYGDTHTVSLDTWKPDGQAKQTQPAPSTARQAASTPTDYNGDSVPF